jgi:hypothetical protein
VFEVVQQHAAVVALLRQQLLLGMAQAGNLVLLGEAGRVQLATARQFGDGGSAMFLEQLARLGTKQVVAMAGLADGDQVAVAAREAAQKRRQPRAREQARRRSLDVGLDAQLERLDLAPEQGRETPPQFSCHIDVGCTGVLRRRCGGPTRLRRATIGCFVGITISVGVGVGIGIGVRGLGRIRPCRWRCVGIGCNSGWSGWRRCID